MDDSKNDGESISPESSKPVIIQPTVPPADTTKDFHGDQTIQELEQALNVVKPEVMPQALPEKKSKKLPAKSMLLIVFVGLLLFGGAAAAYITVFQKSPEKLWESALSNTADGIEKYLESNISNDATGLKANGYFKVSSPIAVDGSMNGAWNNGNGSLLADVGAAGARVNMEVRAIAENAESTPDIYLKIDGLEGVDELVGSLVGPMPGIAESLSAINGQWYFIDHTLIDQSLAGSGSDSTAELTEEEYQKIVDQMMVVMRDYVFSVDEQKAIFNIEEKIGEEEFEGTPSYKMRVSVDQENFKEFVTALKDAAKGTELETLLMAGQTDRTLEEVLSFDELIKQLEKADFSGAGGDVWVEGNGRYIRNVRLYPVDDKKDTNYADFGMKYEGGDELPLYIKLTMDDEGTKGTLAFGFTINQANGNASMSMNADMTGGGTSFKAEAQLSAENSNDPVTVEKPADAKNIFELLGDFQSIAPTSIPYGDDGLYGSDVYPLDDTEL